jgi:hypothetical protein
MLKCKWAGDANDEYCKGCDGIQMEMEGNVISCEKCAGYEAGTESVQVEKTEPDTAPTEDDKNDTKEDAVEGAMNPPEEEVPARPTTETKKPTQNKKKDEKVSKSTIKTEKAENKPKSKSGTKVSEEKKATEKEVETPNGEIKVVSLRYTSGATIKKGDNYFKFIAEEEWDVSQIENVADAREQLWAKLNAEVDAQIEELENIK